MDNQPLENQSSLGRDLLMLALVSVVSVAGSYGLLRIVYWLFGWDAP